MVAALWLAGAAAWAQSPAALSDTADPRRDLTVAVVERVLPSVVNVATRTVVEVRDPWERILRQYWEQFYRQRAPDSVGYSLGSGVIIDEAGYLLSNAHVVRRADKVWIKPATGTNVYEAVVVAVDPKTDLAVLKIQAPPGEKFPAIKFAKDDDLLLGETVLAMGNPFGLGGSVSRGILSSKSRQQPAGTEVLEVPHWLQTDAAINHGSSGGPLVNLRGELIGLSVAMLEQAQGINFAIPVRQIADSLADMVTPEASSCRLWFGARVRTAPDGLKITSVQPGSPASQAGLRAGDIIAELDGVRPTSFLGFNTKLLNEDRREATLTVMRNERARKLTVRLVPLGEVFNASYIRQKLGLQLKELEPNVAQSLPTQLSGSLLVTDVDRQAAGSRAPQTGALITAIDGRQPIDLVDAAYSLASHKAGEHIPVVVVTPQRWGNGVNYRQETVTLPVH
jgi:serine protease Do